MPLARTSGPRQLRVGRSGRFGPGQPGGCTEIYEYWVVFGRSALSSKAWSPAMDRQRRKFVYFCLSAVGPSLSNLSLLRPQRPAGGVHPPEPAEPLVVITNPDNGVSSRGRLESDRGQQFRRCLGQICDCANKLRNAASNADLATVFPVKFYKETQLLERLVKHLKALAKA